MDAWLSCQLHVVGHALLIFCGRAGSPANRLCCREFRRGESVAACKGMRPRQGLLCSVQSIGAVCSKPWVYAATCCNGSGY